MEGDDAINGLDLHYHGVRHDQYSARGNLKAGRNEVLLKVCQNEQEENWAQEWTVQVRVCDSVGAAAAFTEGKAEQKEGGR